MEKIIRIILIAIEITMIKTLIHWFPNFVIYSTIKTQLLKTIIIIASCPSSHEAQYSVSLERPIRMLWIGRHSRGFLFLKMAGIERVQIKDISEEARGGLTSGATKAECISGLSPNIWPICQYFMNADASPSIKFTRSSVWRSWCSTVHTAGSWRRRRIKLACSWRRRSAIDLITVSETAHSVHCIQIYSVCCKL